MAYTRYDEFADVYNRHWKGFAEHVIPILDLLVLAENPPPLKVLDVCCGTGQLDAVLSERGYDVTGLDGSAEMIRHARANAPAASFVVDDARTFALPQEYDLAFCIFDSLNHILDLNEVIQVFERVYAALKPGGVFEFDMNFDPGYQRRGDGMAAKAEDDQAFMAQWMYDAIRKRAQLDLTLFYRQPDGINWQRRDVIIEQACYPKAHIVAGLEGVGFTEVQLFDAIGFKAAPIPEDRIFFTARRG